jgi:hypothetical protein
MELSVQYLKNTIVVRTMTTAAEMDIKDLETVAMMMEAAIVVVGLVLLLDN